ncbi:MAG: pyridoxal phosphate-dependent aminotransferase [Planctomycetes bacterium]|jgi:aspartate/methionine/tyrosine aminotransferase|nr:pyridoxal phosphate-dependent aminotransferase [Planctomycetota bacterium]
MEFEPFSYMRHAKRLEYADGIYMAGSGMFPPKAQELSFSGQDFDLNALCNSYGDPRNIEWLATRYKCSGQNVVLTAGSSEANFLAFSAVLEPGDKVLIETPGYGQFNSLATFCGCRPVKLKRRAENGFAPDLTEFKRLLDDKTKLVVLTDLHNPSMAKLPADLLKDMVKAAGKKGATVLVDEVYIDHLPLNEHDDTSFHYGDNVIVTSSLTKVYGLSSLRFGWALAPVKIAGTMLDLADVVDPEISPICQNMAVKALANLSRLRSRTRGLHERNWGIVAEWLKTRKDIEAFVPPGGVVCWMRIKGLDETGSLATVLRNEYGVLVVPGEYFQSPGWLRVGYKNPPAELRDGLARIGRAIDDLKAHKKD